MSKADELFIGLCKDILENGSTTENQVVRPKWEDGTSAYTIKKFGVCLQYDLREEFPALTLRKTALKSCMDEILWIYQKKSNNVKDLNSHIWDEWANEYGSIGSAYGYQVKQSYKHHKEYINGDYILKHWYEFSDKDPVLSKPRLMGVPEIDFINRYLSDKKSNVFHRWISMDQMNAVLYDLKNNPFSRRIMIDLWNIKDLHEMNLQPCCYNVIFNVTDEGGDKLVLNMTLNQRSSDTLTANNWNICQYAILLMMVAQVSDMVPGRIMHCITDAHIYDRHVDLVKELINRKPLPAPKVRLNPEVTDFYKFTTNDLIVENYEVAGPQLKIPVAV